MLQMDMTAWVKEGTKESVGIIQDFVDPDLTAFLEGLVGEYRKSCPTFHRSILIISRYSRRQDQMWIRVLGSLVIQQSRLSIIICVSLECACLADTYP